MVTHSLTLNLRGREWDQMYSPWYGTSRFVWFYRQRTEKAKIKTKYIEKTKRKHKKSGHRGRRKGSLTQINQEESCTPVSSNNPTQLLTKEKGMKEATNKKQKEGRTNACKTQQQKCTLYVPNSAWVDNTKWKSRLILRISRFFTLKGNTSS